MYFKRDIEDDILAWYNSSDKKVLRVDGARQVGKTATIDHFIAKHYTNVIKLDLARLDYSWFLNCINGSTNNWARIDVDRFRDAIKDYARFTNDKNTVIFIDEIQQDYRIYNQLRTLNRDLKCDVIASGSYLSRALNTEYFQSVGDVTTITLYTLSFCEFLHVFNDSIYNTVMSWPENEIDNETLDKLRKLFNYYTLTGGYPEVLNGFIKHKMNYEEVLTILSNIIDLTLEESKSKIESVVDRLKIDDVADGLLTTLITNKRGSTNLYESIVKNLSGKPNSRISKDDCSKVISWFRECKMLGMVSKYILPDMFRDYSGEKDYFLDLGMLRMFARMAKIVGSDLNGLIAETFVHRAMITNDYAKKFTGTRPHFGIYKDGEIDFFAYCNADKCNYAFEVKYGNQSGKTATDLIKNHVADKIVYFMGNHNHAVNGDVEIVPLCLAERWFSEVKYETFEPFDATLFDANVFEEV